MRIHIQLVENEVLSVSARSKEIVSDKPTAPLSGMSMATFCNVLYTTVDFSTISLPAAANRSPSLAAFIEYGFFFLSLPLFY